LRLALVAFKQGYTESDPPEEVFDEALRRY